MRIGHGYDVHRLVENRPEDPIQGVILGGIVIPYEKHLLGHSDADVLIHAMMDALLGAAGMENIGVLFPDSDPAYRGISSISLLQEVCRRLREDGWEIGNIDATILMQKPKVSPYLPQIRESLARAMETETDRVNVKATTEEGLGFTGCGDGAAAHAVCLIEKRK